MIASRQAMVLLVVYVVIALGASFLCSIMEAVLLSVTPSFVALQGRKGTVTAKRLRALKEDIDRPLAAILSLNTIAHTVGAAGAGAQAAVVFGSASLGIVSAILTLLILVLSEIIPKTLGAVYWKALTPAVVAILWPLIYLLWPLVKVSQALTRLLARRREDSSVSPAEVAALAELGAREGVIEQGESRILKNLFLLRSLRVRDIMTPRIVVFMLPEEVTIGSVVDTEREIRFSRIPVYRTGPDDVTGFVLRDEILLDAARGDRDRPLRAIRRDLLPVPETLPLPELFERMLEGMEHIALVVDEYGGTAGVVTLEDLVETLLGLEIVDEADATRDMQVLARQQWLRRAHRMGLRPEDLRTREEEAAIRLGLTGVHPPDDGTRR